MSEGVQDNTAREIRRALFLSLEAASSPATVSKFQRCLADEILYAEERRKNGEIDWDIKNHVMRLRMLGDALAWNLLHPHAIRNLSKNAGKPPTLYDRRPEVALCLESIHALAVEGASAIFSDLTHCLRIGDLIVVRDPEMPDILEIKAKTAKKQHQHQGRRGRQLHRMQRTTEYLRDGHAKFFDEAIPRLSLEIDVVAQYDFPHVDRTVSEALANGYAIHMIRRGQWIGACRTDSAPVFSSKLSVLEDRTVCLGLLTDALPNLLHEVSPPFNWPICRAAREALMEGDVALVHMISAETFEEYQVSFVRNGPWAGGFDVPAGDTSLVCSPYFLRRALYGFETIESVVAAMRDFASKAFEFGVRPLPAT